MKGKPSRLVFEETRRVLVKRDDEDGAKWVNVTVLVHCLALPSESEGADSYYLIRCQVRGERPYSRFGAYWAKEATLRDAVLGSMTDAMAIREAIGRFDRMMAEHVTPFLVEDERETTEELPF